MQHRELFEVLKRVSDGRYSPDEEKELILFLKTEAKLFSRSPMIEAQIYKALRVLCIKDELESLKIEILLRSRLKSFVHETDFPEIDELRTIAYKHSDESPIVPKLSVFKKEIEPNEKIVLQVDLFSWFDQPQELQELALRVSGDEYKVASRTILKTSLVVPAELSFSDVGEYSITHVIVRLKSIVFDIPLSDPVVISVNQPPTHSELVISRRDYGIVGVPYTFNVPAPVEYRAMRNGEEVSTGSSIDNTISITSSTQGTDDLTIQWGDQESEFSVKFYQPFSFAARYYNSSNKSASTVFTQSRNIAVCTVDYNMPNPAVIKRVTYSSTVAAIEQVDKDMTMEISQREAISVVCYFTAEQPFSGPLGTLMIEYEHDGQQLSCTYEMPTISIVNPEE